MKIRAASWWAWSFAVLFLFYEFIVRVFPTVMVQELMGAFDATAAQLGTLSAFFFYAYAPMQIPVGLLMDRFGARNLLTFASLFCGFGSLLFAAAHHIIPADIGRFLMGIGSSFAFVGMVYVCSHWFPAKKLALLVGIGNSLGMLGAFGAQGPLSFVVETMGWRFTVVTFGITGIVLALVLFFFMKKAPGQEKIEVKKASFDLAHNLKKVASNGRTWLNAAIALLFYMTTAAFASLWGIPFLSEGYGIDRNVAAFAISMIFIGWIIGGPIIGYISDRFSKRKPFLYGGIFLCLLSLIPVIYIPHLPMPLLFILLFLVGFFQAAQLLSFSLGIEINAIEAKGTSIALTNFCVATGSSLMQPLLGILLDSKWDGAMREGIPFYSIADYHFAMVSFPITLILAFVLLLFLKETKHEPDAATWSKISGMD
ncbi:MFS transporter [Candidatus Neptunochlamydia vexilliferae]|nr:MFS transporter [Candidatus Neptunochlamydia vexilliferae]